MFPTPRPYAPRNEKMTIIEGKVVENDQIEFKTVLSWLKKLDLVIII